MLLGLLDGERRMSKEASVDMGGVGGSVLCREAGRLSVLTYGLGELCCDLYDASLASEPASARPSRLEIEGNEHFGSSMGGDGGGR